MANFWNDPNVTPANTAVVIIDPVLNMMNAGRGRGNTIGGHQIQVVHDARSRNIPIFEVNVLPAPALGAVGRTPQSLIRAFSSDDPGNQYAHLRTFQKPGARGANADDCLEYDLATLAWNNVGGGIWERRIGAQINPPVTFMTAIAPYANVVVMGQDGSQCVLSTIFGNWAYNIAAAPLNVEYKPGLLDQPTPNRVVITSYAVVMTGAAAGALPACYCALRAGANVPAVWL